MSTSIVSKVVRVGPEDDGKRMALADFDHAEGRPGYRYELSRGVIRVMDIPKPRHGLQIDAIHQQVSTYRAKYPKRIYYMAAGSDCKLLLWDFESERHPDLAIYKRPPADLDADDIWSTWIPDIVVEIVSLGSELRDYVEKREEYLAFGVREYWVFNLMKRELLVHRRVGKKWQERVIRPPAKYKTRLLPGFELSVTAVFDAAKVK